MGRIADSVDDPEPATRMYTNLVDDILDGLDADDLAVVVSWLRGPMSNRDIEMKLLAHDIVCSSSSVGNWRAAQRDGIGRAWDV